MRQLSERSLGEQRCASERKRVMRESERASECGEVSAKKRGKNGIAFFFGSGWAWCVACVREAPRRWRGGVARARRGERGDGRGGEVKVKEEE